MKRIYYVVNVIFLSMMLASCSIEIFQYYDDEGGEFTVINTATSDVLVIDGSKQTTIIKTEIITIEDGDTVTVLNIDTISGRELYAHIGDTIRIKFEPKNDYKNYSFTTKYTLPKREFDIRKMLKKL